MDCLTGQNGYIQSYMICQWPYNHLNTYIVTVLTVFLSTMTKVSIRDKFNDQQCILLKFSKWKGGTLAHGCRGRTAPSHSRSCTLQTQPRERTLTDTCYRMWTNQTQPSYCWHIIFVHTVCLSNRMLGRIRTARAVVCWGRRRGEEEGLGDVGYPSNHLKW